MFSFEEAKIMAQQILDGEFDFNSLSQEDLAEIEEATEKLRILKEYYANIEALNGYHQNSEEIRKAEAILNEVRSQEQTT